MTTSRYPDAPRVAVGALVCRDNRILLIKRGKSPSKGIWSVPGGRVELGETLQEAAEREVLEETGISVKAGDPVYVFDMISRDENAAIEYHFVIVDVSADYLSGEIKAGDDAVDARWVRPDEMRDLGVSERTIRLVSLK
ncbi:MAG: NUDIX hydrolase [Desulfobacterales bacterium]